MFIVKEIFLLSNANHGEKKIGFAIQYYFAEFWWHISENNRFRDVKLWVAAMGRNL